MKHAGDGKAVTTVVACATENVKGHVLIRKFFNKPTAKGLCSAFH